MAMMTSRPGRRYRVSDDPPPADLKGKARADRVLTIGGKLLERTYLSYVERTDYKESAGYNPDTAMTLVVSDREVVAHDDNVVRLTLTDPDCGELPRWQPGSHLDFHLPSGLSRQYSLCGDPSDRSSYSIAVRRIPEGGGGSVEMHALEPGSLLTVRGPRNGFPFVGEGSALFIAGGIGITPIIAMVRAATDLGMDWQFVYTGRSRDSMPFLDEIATLDPDRVVIRTDEEDGLPTTADLLSRAPVGGAVYCCGPTPMLDLVRTSFSQTDSTALHFERFGAPPVVDGVPFEVQLVTSGEVIEIPADRSALSVVKERVPAIGYSCQQGFCGTCRVRVLSGSPDHRESRLTPEEQESEMLICVSRADGGRLVLDI